MSIFLIVRLVIPSLPNFFLSNFQVLRILGVYLGKITVNRSHPKKARGPWKHLNNSSIYRLEPPEGSHLVRITQSQSQLFSLYMPLCSLFLEGKQCPLVFSLKGRGWHFLGWMSSNSAMLIYKDANSICFAFQASGGSDGIS